MTSTDGTGAKRVRLDYDERRRQILQAASTLFLQRPYSEVSISDIAEAAGVARGLLHHYFDSKRDLYLEVVRQVSSTSEVPLPATDTPPDADDTGWVRAVDALLGFVTENADLWLTSAMLAGPGLDDEVATIVQESREVIAEQTIAALGLADRDTPELRALVRGYGGLVQEVTLEWLERGRLTRDQARDVLVQTLPLLLEHVLPGLEEGPPQLRNRADRRGDL